MKLKVGKRVKIIGDREDGTLQFHGCLGTILEVGRKDCLVAVDAPNNFFDPWIWNRNLVEPDAEI